jgi:putative acetyltransferase
MSLSVRPYRPDDRAAAALIFYRAVREGAADFYDAAQREAWAPSPEPDAHEADKLVEQWCWIAERDGRPVGFMSLEPSGYLDMAFVLPDEMGRGTARALYAALVARARAEGLNRLWVTASHLARRFFLARGWRVVWMENLCADGQAYVVFRMVIDLDGLDHD